MYVGGAKHCLGGVQNVYPSASQLPPPCSAGVVDIGETCTASAGRIGSGFVALHGSKSLLWCKSMFVPAESCLKTTSKLLGTEFGSGNSIQNWPKIQAQEVQETP